MTGYAPPFDGIKTLHDLWESTCSRHSDEECLGTRDVAPDGTPGAYRWMTYAQLHERRAACSSGYVARGLKPGDHVGMYSVNTAEWCAGTVTPLGDSVRRMLADDTLKSRIDSDDSLTETFHALVTHAR